MKEAGDGFVRADQIDLRSLDEQLERHLSRTRTMEKKKRREEERGLGGGERRGEEWEIDPSKLVIKGVIARGTYGTVHRGIYDGHDVAGEIGNNVFVISRFHQFLVLNRFSYQCILLFVNLARKGFSFMP